MKVTFGTLLEPINQMYIGLWGLVWTLGQKSMAQAFAARRELSMQYIIHHPKNSKSYPLLIHLFLPY